MFSVIIFPEFHLTQSHFLICFVIEKLFYVMQNGGLTVVIEFLRNCVVNATLFVIKFTFELILFQDLK